MEEIKPLLPIEYFNQRMDLLGATPADYTTELWHYDATTGQNVLKPVEIFRVGERGIDIYPFDLDQNFIRYKPRDKDANGSRFTREFKITRLANPEGDMKYQLPAKAGTYPFFPPKLAKKFLDRTPITTLVLTEGYFKAFKASMHGIDCVGLSSITHIKDRETGALYVDVLRLIKTCQVKSIIWLADGDCNNISLRALENEDDLLKRPVSFFQSVYKLKEALSAIDIEKYFKHPLTDELDGNPKGLDDLLVAMKGQEDAVAEDLLNFSSNNKYFFKESFTFSTDRIRRYFHLHNLDAFVEFHAEKVPEIKKRGFKYAGSKYQWDAEKNIARIIVPGEASNYFRVGDDYYEKIKSPNKYGQLEHKFVRRMKSTITDDYGKEFCQHIAKYKSFCVVPDHINYQEVIHNCYNLYAPFEHEAGDEDSIEHTLAFLRHIFGSREIEWTNPKDKKKVQLTELDLGLDYIQLLYQKPTQILPILCLVSRENQTGKTTFGKWLKLLFTHNVAIVGNAELSSDFNAFWASKLLIICDEAKIDKQVVVEKVKSLSTTDKITMNSKGRDQVELEFFGKFIFITNNEENFIYASEDDVRYWIRKVPKIATEKFDNDMLLKMQEEIPAFLTFINKRKIATPQSKRAWIDPALTETEALKKVIAFSYNACRKEITSYIREAFLDHGVDEIRMSRQDISHEILKSKFESNYVNRILNDEMKVPKWYVFRYNDQIFETMEALQKAIPGYSPELVDKLEKSGRYEYPKWETSYTNGTMERRRIWVKANGRPFIFSANQYLSKEELRLRAISGDRGETPDGPFFMKGGTNEMSF